MPFLGPLSRLVSDPDVSLAVTAELTRLDTQYSISTYVLSLPLIIAFISTRTRRAKVVRNAV